MNTKFDPITQTSEYYVTNSCSQDD